MSNVKTFFTALTMLFLITTTAIASNTPNSSLSVTLRTELSQLVQNPGLAEKNLEEASILVQFSIDSSGKITVLNSQTDTPFLIDFIEHKVNGKQVSSVSYEPEKVYLVRFRFESK